MSSLPPSGIGVAFDAGYFDQHHEITDTDNSFVAKLHGNIEPEQVCKRAVPAGYAEASRRTDCGDAVLGDRYVRLTGSNEVPDREKQERTGSLGLCPVLPGEHFRHCAGHSGRSQRAANRSINPRRAAAPQPGGGPRDFPKPSVSGYSQRRSVAVPRTRSSGWMFSFSFSPAGSSQKPRAVPWFQ